MLKTEGTHGCLEKLVTGHKGPGSYGEKRGKASWIPALYTCASYLYGVFSCCHEYLVCVCVNHSVMSESL